MGRRRARLWALFQCCYPKAKAKTRRNLASDQVLEAERPEELATSTEELSVCRQQLLAKEEEIALLIAERNNTRLLLEHLEWLVSRHVPSLQMTVDKGQVQSPASMTSEMEVLKAMKSLFEHHQALDTKRTRDGLQGHDEDLAQVMELQEIIENKSREQSHMKDRLAALSAHVTELEKDLDTARKDLLQSKEVNVNLQRDVREAMAQKQDMEKRITTLEKRYLAAQHKAISVHNVDDKLENEIASKDSMQQQKEEKDRQLQVCLELADQKLQQMLLEVGAELAPRVAALSKARQREQMNEEHNERLSDTVDKLLSESDERLQPHLKEKTAALEDKNSLLWGVENAKKHLEEMQNEKVQPLKDQDRERGQQASVLANVAQVFESDEGVSDGDGVTLFSSPALLSSSGQGDANILPVMIQEQLNKINEEIWLIQQEENTDQWAEGIESSVGRRSLSNLRRFKSSDSLNLNPASWHAGSCPPSRGCSKPQRRPRSPAPEGDKLGFTTLPSDSRKHCRKLPALQEEVEDDETTVEGETSTSALQRSLQLERLDTGSLCTASDEDIRDACNSKGSQDGPGGNPSSSSSSSQDSLQKAPKKRGIKASVGRLFSKKEKGRPGHTSKQGLGPVAGRIFTALATWKAPGNADN